MAKRMVLVCRTSVVTVPVRFFPVSVCCFRMASVCLAMLAPTCVAIFLRALFWLREVTPAAWAWSLTSWCSTNSAITALRVLGVGWGEGGGGAKLKGGGG